MLIYYCYYKDRSFTKLPRAGSNDVKLSQSLLGLPDDEARKGSELLHLSSQWIDEQILCCLVSLLGYFTPKPCSRTLYGVPTSVLMTVKHGLLRTAWEWASPLTVFVCSSPRQAKSYDPPTFSPTVKPHIPGTNQDEGTWGGMKTSAGFLASLQPANDAYMGPWRRQCADNGFTMTSAYAEPLFHKSVTGKACKGSERTPIHAILSRLFLTIPILLCCKMNSQKWQAEYCLFVIAKSRRVPHDFEPLSLSNDEEEYFRYLDNAICDYSVAGLIEMPAPALRYRIKGWTALLTLNRCPRLHRV